MSSINFIQQHGVEKAMEVLSGAPELAEYYSTIDGEYYRIEINAVNLKQLKRLVESVDLINGWGGIQTCKYLIKQATSHTRPHEKSFAFELKQTIADYEAIYES